MSNSNGCKIGKVTYKRKLKVIDNVNYEVISLLKEGIEEAEKSNVSGFAVVLVLNDGREIDAFTHGSEFCRLVGAVEALKSRILLEEC